MRLVQSIALGGVLALVLAGCGFADDDKLTHAAASVDGASAPERGGGVGSQPIPPPSTTPDTQEPPPSEEQPPSPSPAPAAWAAVIDNEYLPFPVGAEWVYEGERDGLAKREEVQVGDEDRTILGVRCRTVAKLEYLDGRLSERTTKWYAQSGDGTVWMFGEESLEFDGAGESRSADSWLAGIDGARPSVAMPAAPEVGARYEEDHPGDRDSREVVSTSQVAMVPAGSFQDCVEVREISPNTPEEADNRLYAAGIGLVLLTDDAGALELVRFRLP